MQEGRIKIHLEVTNEYGSRYAVEAEMDADGDYASIYNQIGVQVNNLMKVAGYLSYDKDTVFMESVTDAEVELLDEYLWRIRNGKIEV